MALITNEKNGLLWQTAQNISVPHGFTSRIGGISTGVFEALNIGLHRGDDPENVEKNYALLGETLGFDCKKLVFSHQTHSDIIRIATAEDWGKELPECDAIITNTPGTALTVFTADCTPILLWDPVTGAVGAVHAGWRGTAANIAGKTVEAMEKAFGCDPANIRAAIGPNIGPCCFETDADVPHALSKTYGLEVVFFIRRREGKYFPDLKTINAMSLGRAGVETMELSDHCTACRQDLYWSARHVGNARGSQGAIIVCGEGTA